MRVVYQDLSVTVDGKTGWSEWVTPWMDEFGVQHYRIACCDCGLVHRVAFYVDSTGEVSVAFRRDNRGTGQVRRQRDHICKASQRG